MPPLTTGTRLGPYEILGALGAGGMGEVYRAKDTKLGRDIALKILPVAFTTDAERLARFRREAQVLASLNHPHIGAIYGLDEANAQQFLVLELVDGESLDRRIARGAIPVDEALGIAGQIAEALEAAHEKGIIHRDLKPANIALTRDGNVNTPAFEGGAEFSPDGQWLAYVSDESGQMQVYIRPFPAPDRKWQVSTEGGTAPVWNRNGRELFYRTGNKMMAVDVTTGSDVTLSAPRLLFEQTYAFGPTITIGNYDVHPDGQRFLMVKDEPSAGRLNVELNWFDELKRLVPTTR